KAIGNVCSVQIGLTMLPVSRDTVLSRFLKINFDDGLKFHRLSGALSVFYAVIHTFGYIMRIFTDGGITDKNLSRFFKKVFLIGISSIEQQKYETYMGILGFMSLVIFVWVGVNSLQVIRRHAYMWFYVNHFLVIVAILFGFMHASPLFYNITPGIILYTIDGLTRLIQSTNHYTIDSITKEPNGYLRLQISNFNREIKPGQWISFNIPYLHRYEYHPFTVVEGDVDTKVLVLLVKPSISGRKGGNAWTNKLGMLERRFRIVDGRGSVRVRSSAVVVDGMNEDTGDGDGNEYANEMTSLLKKSDGVRRRSSLLYEYFINNTNSSISPSRHHIDPRTCHIHGPFGNIPVGFLESSHMMILCAGSGITGGINIAMTILKMKQSNMTVRIVWTTNHERSREVTDWKALVGYGESCCDRLRVARVHRTCRGDGSDRVDVEGIFGEWRKEIEGEGDVEMAVDKFGGGDMLNTEQTVSVFTCGPESFTHRVAVAAEVFSRRVVHVEGFER
ncbi:ferric/cupric-chelate reductase, partial [Blyttiomyces sp. JEL0837]